MILAHIKYCTWNILGFKHNCSDWKMKSIPALCVIYSVGEGSTLLRSSPISYSKLWEVVSACSVDVYVWPVFSCHTLPIHLHQGSSARKHRRLVSSQCHTEKTPSCGTPPASLELAQHVCSTFPQGEHPSPHLLSLPLLLS